MPDVTEILGAVSRGDAAAADVLLPLVYDELRRLAARNIAQERPGQTLDATGLVHEAYLRLVGHKLGQAWDGRGHFYAAAAEAMHQRKLEAAAREQTTDALARSQFDQAHSVLLAAQPGRRWTSLDLLKHAAARLNRSTSPAVEETSPDPSAPANGVVLPTRSELRTEAVAALLTRDGRVARQFAGHSHAVSPDGKFAASTWVAGNLQDAGLTITDLHTGKMVREWKGKTAEQLSGVMLALSPDAERLAVVSTNLTQIAIWQLSDKTLLRTLTMPTAPDAAKEGGNAAKPSGVTLRLATPRQLSFSPDGRFLVSSLNRTSGESAIVLWPLDGPLEGKIIGACRMSTAVAAFSPDSLRLAFASDYQKVTVWDIAEDRAAAEFALPLKTDGGLGYHPSGNLLAVHAQDGSKWRLLLWDIAANREVAQFDAGALSFITPVRFSPDGSRVAVAGITGAISVFNVPLSPRIGEQPPIRLDHGMIPQLLAWNTNGQLLSGGLGGLKQWEFATVDALSSLPLDQKERVIRLAFSPDGKTVATADSYGSKVTLFDRQTGKLLRSWSWGVNYEASVELRYSPDAKQLVKISPSGVIAWDVNSGEERARMSTAGAGFSSVFSLGFRADGSILAAGLESNKPKVWDVATGKAVWAPASQPIAKIAAVSPNGRFALMYRAFALEGDLSIPVWDLETQQQRFALPGPTGTSFQSLAEISPDNRWILAMHYGGDVAKSFPRGTPETRRLTESPAVAEQFVLPNPVRVTFGTATANLVAPDQEWIGELWNAETGKRHTQIYGPSTIEYYVFSPDGRYLAISMRNGAIRLWDINAGQELFDWRPTAGASGAAFSPRHFAFTSDSTTLATPDPTLPLVHLLSLTRLNQQLGEVALGW